jgi:hypothetical protein
VKIEDIPLGDPNAHGLFLRRDALAEGLTDLVLRRAVRGGELVRVRHGAYVPGPVWRSLDVRQQHLLKVRAVLRTHGERVAASHHSAAAAWGMDQWQIPLDKVHVTRTDHGSGRQFKDLVHHQALVAESDVAEVDGIRVTRAVRAALESATLVDLERALVLVCSGLRMKLFDRAELEAQRTSMEAWPNSLGLELVCRLADDRFGSVGEVRTFFCLWRSALPKPVPQFPVYDGDELVGIVDFAWPELGIILEFDGKVKYEKYLRTGETASDAVVREKRREDRIREATGWVVIRISWDDLAHPDRIVARVRRAMAQRAA